MNWASEKIRLRRYLRDPQANIWDDAQLLRLHNDSQREIQQKTRILEDVKTVRVPPLYDWSYLHDFEAAFLYEGHGPTFQALHYHQESEYVICFPWEGLVLNGVDEDWTGEGSMFTHPFEGFMATPADILPLRFPKGFYEALFVAWDDEPISYVDKKEISSSDPTWKTRAGDPVGYWRPDVTDPYFVLYPQPSAPVWDDTDPTAVEEAGVSVSQDWENSTTYFSENGAQFTRADADNEIAYTHDFEYMHLRNGTDATVDVFRGMRSWEVLADVLGTKTGEVILEDGSIFTTGMKTLSAAVDIYTADPGLSASSLETAGNVLFVYRVEPTDLKDADDEGLYPDYLKKYVEYSTLERAYASDSDGQNDGMRDYWGQRKNLGIEIIKRFASKRKVDRDYRLSTAGAPGRRTQAKYPKLPDGYPAI